MTDRPRYQNSEMSDVEALDYANEELGQQLYAANFSDVSKNIRDFVNNLKDDKENVKVYRMENGYSIQSKMGNGIFNPKEIIGQKPRLWISDQGILNIYFKKNGEYYLIRLLLEASYR